MPLWGRFEVRVVAALVLLGTLCVGASAYLVHLTIEFFDQRMAGALAQGEEVVDTVKPFYRDLLDAQVAEYRSRTRAMALELALRDERGEGVEGRGLSRLMEREPDVAALTLSRVDTPPVSVGGPVEDEGREFRTQYALSLDAKAPGAAQLEVVFRVDPKYDARYQAVGRRKQIISAQQSRRPELEDAVFRAIAIASGLVLLLSFIAGFALARTTTRKVGALTRVMRKVGRGELLARVPDLGGDELGQLGRSFNNMLDQLDAAQRKLAYLQRIGAWQGMARRLAHEIKSPLTPILLAIQQVREKDPGVDPEFSGLLKTSVEIVEDEVDTLRRMVAAFSRFAKVPDVHPQPVPLAQVLGEFERAYGHLTESEDDRLEVERPSPEVMIRGDRQLLKQVLVNLVENAVLSGKEHGQGAVHVRVSTAPDDDARFWRILVDDNGPGISDERREQVFEPYETGREHGTGLGLAIVKKVALDHGGEVFVEDSPLGGARFVLRLPQGTVTTETMETMG